MLPVASSFSSQILQSHSVILGHVLVIVFALLPMRKWVANCLEIAQDVLFVHSPVQTFLQNRNMKQHCQWWLIFCKPCSCILLFFIVFCDFCFLQFVSFCALGHSSFCVPQKQFDHTCVPQKLFQLRQTAICNVWVMEHLCEIWGGIQKNLNCEKEVVSLAGHSHWNLNPKSLWEHPKIVQKMNASYCRNLCGRSK